MNIIWSTLCVKNHSSWCLVCLFPFLCWQVSSDPTLVSSLLVGVGHPGRMPTPSTGVWGLTWVFKGLSHVWILRYIVFVQSQSLPQHRLCLCVPGITRHLSIRHLIMVMLYIKIHFTVMCRTYRLEPSLWWVQFTMLSTRGWTERTLMDESGLGQNEAGNWTHGDWYSLTVK